MKNLIENAKSSLRRKCDGLTPEKRRMVVICSFVVFAALAVYTAVDAIIFQDNRRHLPDVEHIRQMDIPKSKTESINPLIINNDDDE